MGIGHGSLILLRLQGRVSASTPSPLSLSSWASLLYWICLDCSSLFPLSAFLATLAWSPAAADSAPCSRRRTDGPARPNHRAKFWQLGPVFRTNVDLPALNQPSFLLFSKKTHLVISIKRKDLRNFDRLSKLYSKTHVNFRT